MVIGSVATALEGTFSSPWAAVEATQRSPRLPCLLVPQPAHAVLAGELAAALLPEAFGPLPPEILRAIQMHDTGWAASDARQIQSLRAGPASHHAPVSFIAIPPAEMMEAWAASVDAVEAMTPMGAQIVSRHFTLLAQDHLPAHQKFKQAEAARRQRLEAPAEEDWLRWTAALGFCDLVSLYLISGLQQEVEFPLAHPASPQARNAPRVTMQFDGEYLQFTPPIARAESVLTIQGLKHPLPKAGPRAETLTWEIE